jgi:sugar phosphate isomerase/epimerase
MKIGLYTDSLGDLPFAEALDWIAAQGIEAVEIGAGNFSRAPHCNLDQLLEDAEARAAFKGAIESRGLSLSALNCSGNLVDPNPQQAAHAQDTFYKAVRLARLLGLDTIVTMGGCPGTPDGSAFQNWVPYASGELSEWQWAEVLAPFWREAGRFAADHGVRIAIEMVISHATHNPRTLLRLRDIAGPALGANLDPSHLFPQGMDPLVVAAALGGCVFHAHAKDTRINPQEMALNGGMDARPMSMVRERSWTFRTLGYGHGAEWWGDFISILRLGGYDGALSIEHEDRLIGAREGIVKSVQFLQPLVLRTSP